MDDELLDLVNDEDRVMGHILRSKFENTAHDAHIIRGSATLIVNSNEKIWIPKRLVTRSSDPGFWDYSMAEHVSSGETYRQAALRGFKEELNYQIDNSKLKLFTKIPPTSSTPWFTSVFLYRTDIAPTNYSHEFHTAKWMTLMELQELISSGEKVRSGLKTLVSIIKDTGLKINLD